MVAAERCAYAMGEDSNAVCREAASDVVCHAGVEAGTRQPHDARAPRSRTALYVPTRVMRPGRGK